ncbi:unnamed protein product [Toxocara canis]|uniref:Uncharacterized protein n=1 Tax=Toxocara canis TaxID=6265 RepID=A0A3P7FNC6_TOXCA|nr:unnamed protein product [Toxocara canis]
MNISEEFERNENEQSEKCANKVDISKEAEALQEPEASGSRPGVPEENTMRNENAVMDETSRQASDDSGNRDGVSSPKSQEQSVEQEAGEDPMKGEDAGLELELERNEDLRETTVVESSSGETTRDDKDTITSSVLDNAEEEEEEEEETKSSADVGTTEPTPTPSRESTIPLEEGGRSSSHVGRAGKKRSKPPKRQPPKKRKREEEEAPDEPEDDDFVPEPAKRHFNSQKMRKLGSQSQNFNSEFGEIIAKADQGKNLSFLII